MLRDLWTHGLGMGWSRKERCLRKAGYPIPGCVPALADALPSLSVLLHCRQAPAKHQIVKTGLGRGTPSFASLTFDFWSSRSCSTSLFSKHKAPAGCFEACFAERLKVITACKNEIRNHWSKGGRSGFSGNGCLCRR